MTDRFYPRRSTLAAASLLALLLAACGHDTPETPEAVLTTWVTAMNASRGDISARHRAYDLLARAAQNSLSVRAGRASQLSGREISPWEMLAPGRFAMRFAFDPDGLTSVIHGDRAVITARSRSGEAAHVPMVREGGQWRVDLALPAMEAIQVGGDAGT